MAPLRLVLIALVLCATLSAPAHASFPGKNGRFVLSLGDCYFDRYLATMPWRGGPLKAITPRTSPCDDEDQVPSFQHPEPAPDGRSLLAVQSTFPQGFVTMNVDGSGLTAVSVPDEVRVSGPSAPSFAPNGRSFAFDSDWYRNGHETEPVWAVELDGSAARVIRQASACPRGGNCNAFDNPRWSPNGKLIAIDVTTYRYRARKPSAYEGGLWLMRASDGKMLRRIAKPGRFDVDWAPDSRKLVYRTHYQQQEIGGGASGGNLYVVDLKGRTRKLVHRHGIAETHPVWSPDGRWIAWVSMDFTGGDVGFDVFPSLWRVRASGGKPQRIRKLPEPYVEEGDFPAPQLAWLPAP